MGSFTVEGGHRLQGELTVQGSKNGALPLLAASVLVQGKTCLYHCPNLTDIQSALQILNGFGCQTSFSENTAVIDSASADRYCIADEMMREMRSSIVFLGALLGRFGQAEVSSPGGCEIGLRPIDLHIETLKALGAVFEEDGSRIHCSCPNGLRGATVVLSFPSVGATENLLLAASVAVGKTRIINAAREPEIVDLANFLNRCGAKIFGAGEGILEIEGVSCLHGCEDTVSGDRIAAVTYMTSCAVTGGSLTVKGLEPNCIMPLIAPFEKSGCKVETKKGEILFSSPKRLKGFGMVRTMPYPGFPTDSQSAFVAMLCASDGTSLVVENIFESRFKYITQLIKMGADIQIEGRIAVIQGVERLHCADTASPDLRGGSALVTAALGAEGVSRISAVHFIDRGYENLEGVLTSLGAVIKRH
ncbi:MAG TPA: UDP-N-acetylglucosamine 1-carboxyvinyltransferase [Ruminococcaceae bacterium]|nr:UDP-N-acetylglucosamine 1-carboxyvinyltransferase [Oscillospiraceae bacterium]